MVHRRGTPNMSYAFYKHRVGLRSGNPLYATPYRGYQTDINGRLVGQRRGGSLWSAIAPAISRIGSFVGKAATYVPKFVNFVKPFAASAAPVFDAVMSIKRANNEAEQLRLMREMAMQNYDKRLKAERQEAKQLTQEQKDKISQIVAPAAPATTVAPIVPTAPSQVIIPASGSGCQKRKHIRSASIHRGNGFRNF